MENTNNTIEIFIVNNINNYLDDFDYSIESGYANDINHFDHHGKYSEYPAPCRNEKINPINNGKIAITHMDADTFIGLIRMINGNIPNLDYELMEKIDLNGSSVIKDKFNETFLYMIGIGQIARDIKFPRSGNDPIDVTEYINKMMEYDVNEIINIGRKANEMVEESYKNCKIYIKDNIGIWSIGENDSFDPSRPYSDGIDIVIVYRFHHMAMSIYCNPNSKYEFANKTIANIQFAGHPKACGSPRGMEIKYEDAINVFNELIN
jgi:hypothetical protein